MVSVIYHKSDLDGIGSAAVVLLKYPDAELYPAEYGEEKYSIEDFTGKHVIIVDFCPRLIRDIVSVASKVEWCDHHLSAKENYPDLWESLPGNRGIGYGAIKFTWEYLFDDAAPSIVEYISDYDVWEFKYGENTKYIHETAALILKSPNDSEWAELFVDNSKVIEWVDKGALLYQAKESRVNKSFVDVIEKQLWGYKVGIVNSNHDVSELGNYICRQGYDVGLVWKVLSDFKVVVSLRSIGEVDVSKIAKKYDGGGHKNASTFKMHIDHFIEMIR